MAKQFKRFDITKKFSTKEDPNTGEPVPRSYRYGEITVFSDSPIPQDLSIKIEIPEQFLLGDNQLNVWAKRPRENQS